MTDNAEAQKTFDPYEIPSEFVKLQNKSLAFIPAFCLHLHVSLRLCLLQEGVYDLDLDICKPRGFW